MSAHDVQVIQDAYAAFARQDVPGVMAAFDEDIEWTIQDSLPFGGTYHGHEGVGRFFGTLQTYWSSLAVEPQELIDGGDTIVALVLDRATGQGGAVENPTVHVWRMRGGKAVAFIEYTDTAKAMQAIAQPAVAGA